MNRLLTLLLVVGALVAAGAVFVIQHLPWWWSAAMIAGIALVGGIFAKVILKKLLMIPFQMKGAVLEGAAVEVHSANSASAPAREPEGTEARESFAELEQQEREDLAARYFYELDVTITPRANPGGGFSLWEPTELLLVPPDAPADLESLEEEDEVCSVKRWEIAQDGQWQADEIGKYHGPQRLRLLIGVRPGTRRLKFRYYFSTFGEVCLPPAPIQ